jgi:acetyl/propionyl-CoA carboxylase alpha subunit
VKASAGGGGRGMRRVDEAAALAPALEAARREAKGAFGDDTLLVERYVTAPRHVEIQILGDTHGTLLHCFERECSVQRRHQKILEESPSPALDDARRARMCAAAVAAGRAIGYHNAGTVEFVVDASGEFYFLEVNTRLQVEHPVTEEVTGLDLVRLQILVAQGEPLPLRQEDVTLRGHAIEARVYAEDPRTDFLPSTGTLVAWEEGGGPGIRWESGVETSSAVTIHYDPMLAKVIAYGRDRTEAIARMQRALAEFVILGISTNLLYLQSILELPAFRAGDLSTHFLNEQLRGWKPVAVELPAEALAALALHESRGREGAGGESSGGARREPSPWETLPGWRHAANGEGG